MNSVIKWYHKNGCDDNIVISSRIRLARNLQSYPFPGAMSADQKKEVCKKIHAAMEQRNKSDACGVKMDFLELEQMNEAQLVSLVERHLVSPNFIRDIAGKAVILSRDESISIMVNEEDHIRIQVLGAGLCLEETLAQAFAIDDYLDTALNYAFDEKLGFLTACPTNLGTGLRASVMLHLMGLEQLNLIARLASTVSKMGLTIRGTYGEGTKAKNYYYQISNQITLGITEQQVIENLKNITAQIMKQELAAQSQFIKNPDLAQDKVCRVLGLLKYAKSMPYDEMCSFISDLRLGICQKYIPVPPYLLNTLISETGAASLMVSGQQSKLTPQERDKRRCEVIQAYLKEY